MSDDLGQDVDYRLVGGILDLMPGAQVVDVGAEKGGFIDLCLAHGAARVHAFEPLADHFRLLQERLAGESRVHLHPMAVSDRTGSAAFHVATDATGRQLDHHHSLARIEGAKNLRFQDGGEVPIITLADACRDLGLPTQPGLLKLDTEGHDLQALAGLGACRPQVIVCEFWNELLETSGRCPYTLADLADLASSLGYRRQCTVRHGGELVWIELDAVAERPGEWGNVFFFSESLWLQAMDSILPKLLLATTTDLRTAWHRQAQELQAKERVIRELATAAEERLQLINRLAVQPGA